MAVNLNDPRNSLLGNVQVGVGSLANYLGNTADQAQLEQVARQEALGQYLAGATPAGGTIYDWQRAMAPALQQAQGVRPSTAVLPAAQVVQNAPGNERDQQVAQYVESLFPVNQGPQQPQRMTSLPTQSATVMPAGQGQVMSDQGSRPTPQQAPTTVAANGTTNFWQMNQNPTRTWNSISGLPENSLGGQLLLASQLGMSPQQLMSGLDAIQARGITESPYWQDQYNTALQQTGDPDAALAHANLASTQAGQNTAGVFARTLAQPTQQASLTSQDRMYGRTYLNPGAGEVNQGLLSTVSQPYGATDQGNVLARTPDGNVTTLPVGPYSAANASATNAGATAFLNALQNEMVRTPGTGITKNGGRQIDPQMQELQRQRLELQIEAQRQRMDQASAKDPLLNTALQTIRNKQLAGTEVYDQALQYVQSTIGNQLPDSASGPKIY